MGSAGRAERAARHCCLIEANSVFFSEALIEGGVEFFEGRDAVQVVDGDPGQPTAMSSEASCV